MSWLDPLLAIKTQQAGTTAGTRQTINFASGATVTDDPANDRVNVAISATPADASTTVKGIVQLAGDIAGTATSVTVAKVNGVSVSGTPTSGQVIRATSGTASAWASVARGDITNTSGATGDIITGNATTLTRLGIGSTGQVLTVSGGAPVWAASSPTTLWEADLTTGQTAGAWSVPSTGNVIVGSSGTGNLNWGATNFAGTAFGVALVAGSGLEITAPSSASGTWQTGVWTFLDQLGLSFFSGRPFRIWTQSTRSGTIGAGTQTEYWVAGFGDPLAAGVDTYRAFGSGGNSAVQTLGYGTDRSASPGDAVWYSSDVFCMTSCAGNITTAFGSYSGGWPSSDNLYTLNAGAVQNAKLTSLATAYTAKPRFYFIPYVAAGTYTNRKWIIQRIKIEGL